jgi:serine protease
MAGAAAAASMADSLSPPRMSPRLADESGTDRLIVKYRDGTGPQAGERTRAALGVAANRQGVQLSRLRSTASGATVFRISRALANAEARAMAESLMAGDPDIEYAEPDRLLQPLLTPTDPMFAQQWSLSDTTAGIRAPDAWTTSTGAGVTVAVIDTGVRPHADLAANLLPGWDFIGDSFVAADGNGRESDAQDPGDAVTAGYCGSGSAASNSSWHGTHVAGIVAARANNGAGIAGVAYGARVVPLRVLGRCGGYTSDIADAIVWAAGGSVGGVAANANPARVINLSLGARGACDVTTQNAINAARAKGAVVVVAAGNENVDAANASPASCAGVITVAATGIRGGKASYSNFGSKVTLAAPGGDAGAGILSTLNTGTGLPGADSYAQYMGTSMAAPVVSGVVALMFAANRNLTPDQVASLLKSSARAFPAACNGCGAGIVNASAAVAAAKAAQPAPVPVPGPLQLKDIEPNNSVAQAQAVAALPAVVSGSLSTTSDVDFFKVSVAAGKKVVATLSAGPTSGFGLGAYTASGQSLVQLQGVAGRSLQLTMTNGGATAQVLVFRVIRSVGAIGAYTLSLGS